ncbi:MAG: response regulator transcription factor [Magnetococcales bacterium]|nr:response regulator transcription factor [Magnetococcales bacterium]
MRIFLVDDHPLARVGARHVLTSSGLCAIAGEAATGAEAKLALRSLECDGVLLDTDLPDMNGLEIAHWLLRHRPSLKVVVMAPLQDPHLAKYCFGIGIMGYISKDISPELLLDAIKRVFIHNHRFVTPELADRLLAGHGNPEGMLAHATLSPRQLEVLRKLAQGFSQSRVARELRISPSTVATHRRHILERLNIEDHPALVAYALRHGLIG